MSDTEPTAPERVPPWPVCPEHGTAECPHTLEGRAHSPRLSAEQIIAAAMEQKPDPAEVAGLLIDNGWTPPTAGRVLSHLIDAEGTTWVERAPDQFQVPHATSEDNTYTAEQIAWWWGIQTPPARAQTPQAEPQSS